ncbi:MAG: recombination mediator RecR, partial [Cyclobacteriaceae bacterium]|nr:recombination mediator RecR [Cyclobacteriaceae bacterium]
KLPGIGKKTALRLVLHLLKNDAGRTDSLVQSLSDLRHKIQYCRNCHNVSDGELCNICNSPKRDAQLICVVEDLPDVIAIENTGQYHGLYHVLGGIISPIDGIGPEDLNIESLVNRVAQSTAPVEEIILALSPTMEGDTTAFYMTKKLQPFSLKLSAIARGVPIGGELEYTDEITLGRSILRRRAYQVDN